MTDLEKHKKQRNYCVLLLREIKKRVHENLNPILITDNKKLWKQAKPFFSNKTATNSNIIISERNKII